MVRWFQSNEERALQKEQKRYYLLPGQGGRAYQRKQRMILWCAVIVGLLVSAILAITMYWLHHTTG